MKKNDIVVALSKIKYSDSKNSILEDNIVQNVQVFGGEVQLDLTLNNPTLHAKKKLETDIWKVIHEDVYPKADIKFNIKVEKPKESTPSIRGAKIDGVKNIIAIASGKGGVGKSTVTANIAVTLADMGFSVGILDADIYGPSMPIMFDVQNYKPRTKEGDETKMLPAESYGVKIMSIGFFAAGTQAVVWRGPMASKALKQMIRDTHWGELDFLLLDLPPGTGDIHLSIVQELPVTAAAVVSTPQNVALADARKGISMFEMDAIKIPVLGLIENMAFFTPEEFPENKYYIFGRDGVSLLSEQTATPFLGQLPLVQSIREGGDVGYPSALNSDSILADYFKKVTQNLVSELVIRNEKLPETEATRITTMAGCSAVKKQ